MHSLSRSRGGAKFFAVRSVEKGANAAKSIREQQVGSVTGVPALNLSREKVAILLTIFSEPTIPQPESPKKAPPDLNPSGAHTL